MYTQNNLPWLTAAEQISTGARDCPVFGIICFITYFCSKSSNLKDLGAQTTVTLSSPFIFFPLLYLAYSNEVIIS